MPCIFIPWQCKPSARSHAAVQTVSTVVCQNDGFTPAWSVSQWWLAGGGVPWHAVVDRRSGTVAYNAPPITSGRTPHAANHYCDTHQAWIETTILIHNSVDTRVHIRRSAPGRNLLAAHCVALQVNGRCIHPVTPIVAARGRPASTIGRHI